MSDPTPTWFESVPPGWRLRRVGDVARIVNGYPFDSGEFSRTEGRRLVRIRDLLSDDDPVFFAGPSPAGAEIRNGDLLVGMDGDFNVEWWSRGSALLNQRLCCLRTGADLCPRYLFYVLPIPLQVINDLTYFTTVKHLSSFQVAAMRIPFPPLAEQRAIADLLDRKTAAIDALIQKKERALALLQEKRHAIIWQCVTKGLSADGLMRESGREWIGRVPAHWDVARTRHVARLRSGHTPSRLHPEYWVPEECTIPWVSLGDVWQLREGLVEEITETEEKISHLGLANSAARLLPARTVIVSRTASVGFSAIIASPMATTQDFVNWICGPKIRPLYLLYVFRAMRDEFRRLTMGSTHQTIYMPDVAKFVTPVPPLEEQDAIVQRVQAVLAQTDAISRKITRQVDVLRDYRQALITAAVTGQFDVAKEAA